MNFFFFFYQSKGGSGSHEFSVVLFASLQWIHKPKKRLCLDNGLRTVALNNSQIKVLHHIDATVI